MAESGKMRALVKETPCVGYELQEMPVPEVGRDEVLFRVEKVAICGSDIALHLWNEVAKVIATLPFIPGMSQGINLSRRILKPANWNLLIAN